MRETSTIDAIWVTALQALLEADYSRRHMPLTVCLWQSSVMLLTAGSGIMLKLPPANLTQSTCCPGKVEHIRQHAGAQAAVVAAAQGQAAGGDKVRQLAGSMNSAGLQPAVSEDQGKQGLRGHTDSVPLLQSLHHRLWCTAPGVWQLCRTVATVATA